MSTILIAEDHPTSRHYLAGLLRHCGHTVFEASNGQDALNRMRQTQPDLLLTDIRMPVMDGYALVREIRTDESLAPTRIVFLTAASLEAEARRLAKACGVHSIIRKPVEPEKLIASVEDALNSPHSRAAGSAEEMHRRRLEAVIGGIKQQFTGASGSHENHSPR